MKRKKIPWLEKWDSGVGFREAMKLLGKSMMSLPSTLSLSGARVWFAMRARKDGDLCPVCGRFGKIYGRLLNKQMASDLIWIFRRSGPSRRWVDVPKEGGKEVLQTKQYSTLKYWGLIESKPNVDDPSKKCSGLWRITELGQRFVLGKIRLPERVWHYNDVCYGFSGKRITIFDAIGNRFHYRQMMSKRLDP